MPRKPLQETSAKFHLELRVFKLQATNVFGRLTNSPTTKRKLSKWCKALQHSSHAPLQRAATWRIYWQDLRDIVHLLGKFDDSCKLFFRNLGHKVARQCRELFDLTIVKRLAVS